MKVKFDSNDFLPALPFDASAFAAAADTTAATFPPTVTPAIPDAGGAPESATGSAELLSVPPSFARPLVPPEGANAELDVGAPEAESGTRGANTKPLTDAAAGAGAGAGDAPVAGNAWSGEVPFAAAAPGIAAGGPNVNAAPLSLLTKPIAGAVPVAPEVNPVPSPPDVGTAGTPVGDVAGKEEENAGGGVEKEPAEGGPVRDDCRVIGPVPRAATAAAAAAVAAPATSAPGTDLPPTLTFSRPPSDKGDEAAEEEEEVALLNADATATAEPLLEIAARRGTAAAS